MSELQAIIWDVFLLIGCIVLLVQLSIPSKEKRKQASEEKKRKAFMDSGYKKCMDSVKNMKDEDTKSRV